MKRLGIGNDRLKGLRADTFETFYFLSQKEHLNDAFKIGLFCVILVCLHSVCVSDSILK